MKKYVKYTVVMLLVVLFSGILNTGCLFSGKKFSADDAIKYMKGRYGEEFTYVSDFDDHQPTSSSYELYLKCDKYPEQNIYVKVIRSGEDFRYVDSFISVKYEKQTLDLLEGMAKDVYGPDCRVIYNCGKNSELSENIDPNISFEDYLQIREMDLSCCLKIAPGHQIENKDQDLDKLEQSIKEKRFYVRYSIYYAADTETYENDDKNPPIDKVRNHALLGIGDGYETQIKSWSQEVDGPLLEDVRPTVPSDDDAPGGDVSDGKDPSEASSEATSSESTEATESTTEAPTETTAATETTSAPETTEETTAATAAPTKSDLPKERDEDYLSYLKELRRSIVANASYYDSLDNVMKESWCFKRMEDHAQSRSYEFFKIADYNGVYVNKNVSDDDKVIYLTFDCGYPSDKTVSILDTLAKHGAKASFFVTKMYLEKCSDYAVRMKQEGHMVCNHTVTHTDLVPKSVEEIAGEIFDVAEYFYEKTGYKMDPYFRTPKGTYTPRLMTIISDCGYKTVFWSIAYNDYEPSAQPEPGFVTNHFATYHHNGAIALMHNDSQSNVNELDAVLTLLENEGYRFGLLNELD